jgi:hypothetical protein
VARFLYRRTSFVATKIDAVCINWQGASVAQADRNKGPGEFAPPTLGGGEGACVFC